MNKTRYSYYKYHPRNFANEYCIYRVSANARKMFNAFLYRVSDDINATCYRISRRNAMRECDRIEDYDDIIDRIYDY